MHKVTVTVPQELDADTVALREILQGAKAAEMVQVPADLMARIDAKALAASTPALLEIRKRERRWSWLHSAAAIDAEGYEWGVFRVKYENGRAVDIRRTRADCTDLDAAMGPLCPDCGEDHGDKASAPKRAELIEAKAREIYDGWKRLPGWVPWVDGGNSYKQDEARREAAAGVTPINGQSLPRHTPMEGKAEMTTDKCTGLFGRLLGHNYQARYSIGKPTADPNIFNSPFSMVFSGDMAGVIAASRPKTYRGDVCARCGRVVNDKATS